MLEYVGIAVIKCSGIIVLLRRVSAMSAQESLYL